MRLLQAIKDADILRPNDIPSDMKAGWVYECEREIVDLMKVDYPVNPFPSDAELLMPSPYDNIYVLYLCAMIDFANQEGTLFSNDVLMYNTALSEAKAWWRREHIHGFLGNWRTM